MNWTAVAVVAFIASIFGTIVAFAFMATAYEYDPPSRASLYVIPFAAALAADALLAGVIW